VQLLYFREHALTNFGDDLNAWMWSELLPGMWDPSDDVWLCGIGTILNQEMIPPGRKWIVAGSGVGYGWPPEDFGGKSWRILGVRGPLTARVLGIDASYAVTDGAILLSALPEYAPLPQSERHGVVFMPHYQSLPAGNWQQSSEAAGIEFLDPRVGSKAIVNRIRSAKLVLADAMHAAIVADTLRVPWIPLVTSPTINTFKWLDWTLSMGLEYRPTKLAVSSALEIWRNKTNYLYGQNLYLEVHSADAAVADFAAKRSERTKPGAKRRMLFNRRLFNSLPLKLYRATSIVGLPHLDRRIFTARAAESLIQAAKLPQFLSSDQIFAARKQQMLDRLNEIPAHIASLNA
jgi:succinoglycan biosynthesis protein ExoV